jgi:hypothetical protein
MDNIKDLVSPEKKFEGIRPMVWQKEPLREVEKEPRRRKALEGYVNPESPTYGNIKLSLRRAGYSEGVVQGFLKRPPKWMEKAVLRGSIVDQAEMNLLEMTSHNYPEQRIKADMTKFVLERLDRSNYGLKGKEELEREERMEGKRRISEEGAIMIENLLKEYGRRRENTTSLAGGGTIIEQRGKGGGEVAGVAEDIGGE